MITVEGTRVIWNLQKLRANAKGSRRIPPISTDDRVCFLAGRAAFSSSSRTHLGHSVTTLRRVRHNRNWPLCNESALYHISSKNASLEQQPRTSSAEAFLAEDTLPSHRRDHEENGALSIRDRLRQWRREQDAALSLANDGNPVLRTSIRDAIPQIQIAAPNSLGLPSDKNESTERKGQVDQGLDLEGENTGEDEVPILSPGDLAAYRIPGAGGSSESLCVFARFIDGQSQFITSKGYWYATPSVPSRSCRIKNFVSPEELAGLLPSLPSELITAKDKGVLSVIMTEVGDIPIRIAEPVVKKLVDFGLEMDGFRRRYATAFEGLYEKLAHDTELTKWAIEEIVPRVFGFPHTELPDAGLLALDKHFGAYQGLYSLRLDGNPYEYWVRSRLDIRVKDKVVNWARMYQEAATKAAAGKHVEAGVRQNPLDTFISKAHRLILKSRQKRSPTSIGTLGPSADRNDEGLVTIVKTGEKVTESERQILHFLFEVLQKTPSMAPDESRSICALIYRAIGAYPNLDLDAKVGRLLLQELGLIPPWHDERLYSYENRLPGLGLWPYQTRLLEKAKRASKDLSVFQDKVQEGLRRDWGDMPVYCIDGVDTLEIDDGLSVERDAVKTDCTWVHVHIANPAAYISPDHPIAVAAKDTASSTYTSSKKYRMMPANFAEQLSSLAPGRKVITFSTLIRPDGSVADIQTSLGTIHNVIQITPDRITEALGGSTPEMATMVIGGTRPAKTQDRSDPEQIRQALPDLRLLQEFLGYRHWKRLVDWPEEERIKRRPEYVRAKGYSTLKDEGLDPSPAHLCHFQGDPVIIVEGSRFPIANQDFRYIPLVDHGMLLAGESAAKWCREREVPIVYNVATPHPYHPVWKLNQLGENVFRKEPESRLSAVAQGHWHLNMQQYTRITSPIRRFVDLFNQWQIQAYLEAEYDETHQNVKQPASARLSRLPFSREAVGSFSAEADHRIKNLSRVATLDTARWICLAFFRALHFKEAELPAIWDLRVTGQRGQDSARADRSGIVGSLIPFALKVELLCTAEGWERMASKGQNLPIKLELVDPDKREAFGRAVGPPSDELHNTDPVHIQSSSTASSAARREATSPSSSLVADLTAC